MHKYLLLFYISSSLLFATRDDGLQERVKEYKLTELLKPHYFELNNNDYKDYIPNDINVNEQLSQRERLLVEDTVYMQIFMLGTMGVLLLLPESISKWDLDSLQEKSLDEKWKENVAAGPVWDEDDFFINYIGHPVSGAWYYTMAKNDGFNEMESFAYSVFVSTFIWEYGYEAFAEVPSIQDLIVTPVIGSLMGEGFIYIQNKIDANNGEVFGSRSLGGICYFFIDPIGNIAGGLSQFFDAQVTMKYQTYQVKNDLEVKNHSVALQKPRQFENYYGVTLNLLF